MNSQVFPPNLAVLLFWAPTSQDPRMTSARPVCLSLQQLIRSWRFFPVTTDKIQQVQTCKLFIKFSHFICTEKKCTLCSESQQHLEITQHEHVKTRNCGGFIHRKEIHLQKRLVNCTFCSKNKNKNKNEKQKQVRGPRSGTALTVHSAFLQGLTCVLAVKPAATPCCHQEARCHPLCC